MISPSPHMKIYLHVGHIDFRKGIDSLIGVCKTQLRKDPFNGHLFVFINRKKTSIKILTYDTQGFWLYQKRLSQGRFTWWPTEYDLTVTIISVPELQLLLWNGDPGLYKFNCFRAI